MEDINIIRHSCAHLVAAAAQALFPGAKFGVGPTVENGFYYDIEFAKPIGESDLAALEEKTKELIKSGLFFEKQEMPLEEAVGFFEKSGQKYKVELLRDLKEKGTTKMSNEEKEALGEKVEKVTLYKSGDFMDLCRGPHIEKSDAINPEAFKITRLAGAYWRGDSKNPQLQRVYGVCFATKEELDEYLRLQEEAEKRDHRKIGKDQELFFIDETVGKGLVMWLPNGTIIRNEIEKLALEKEEQAGFQRVTTSHLAKEELYLRSGHLPYYKDSMYPSMEMDDGTYYLKAMNCPHHHIIFNHQMHSYRDLPLRLAEYGTVYRNELSGTLAGLLRVRALAMNDAHIYCRKDQIKSEFKAVLKMIQEYFEIFGLKNYWFRLSCWSPDHLEKYVNEPENWEYSEAVIREVLDELGVKYVEAKDEAAFYGPKVDVQFKSAVGREETMSTVQLDFVAKSRFGLKYTDETGKENNEVFVVHRAPLSTHERFTAFLIEHYGGVWPVWLAPIQVMLAPVAERHAESAKTLAEEMKKAGLRASVDSADETVGNKVRKASEKKIPYIVVMGDKELESGELTIRVRGQKDQQKMKKEDFIEMVRKEAEERK